MWLSSRKWMQHLDRVMFPSLTCLQSVEHLRIPLTKRFLFAYQQYIIQPQAWIWLCGHSHWEQSKTSFIQQIRLVFHIGRADQVIHVILITLQTGHYKMNARLFSIVKIASISTAQWKRLVMDKPTIGWLGQCGRICFFITDSRYWYRFRVCVCVWAFQSNSFP